MILLFKLILAHLIGDFLLQPKKWVREKENNKLHSVYFYIHILLHATLLVLILQNLTLYWPVIAFITLTHAIIDVVKLTRKNQSSPQWFFIDQFLHITVILLAWHYVQNGTKFPEISITLNLIAIITGFVFLTNPAAIMIKTALIPWQPNEKQPGYNNAGKFIGICERIMIYIFVISAQWQAIGFLLAAKSVFRFKDIQKENEFRMTEYILLGTLLSFSTAILIGLAIQYIIR